VSDPKSQSTTQGAAAADTPQTLPSATTELPPEALARLAPEEEIHLSISTDIKLDGLYGPAWLLATKKRLLAFSPNGGGPPEIVDLPLAEIESLEIQDLYGSGALKVRTQSTGRTVALFSKTLRTGLFVHTHERTGRIGPFSNQKESKFNKLSLAIINEQPLSPLPVCPYLSA